MIAFIHTAPFVPKPFKQAKDIDALSRGHSVHHGNADSNGLKCSDS